MKPEEHYARLRELQRRLDAAQTQDQEEHIVALMDAENKRWEERNEPGSN